MKATTHHHPIEDGAAMDRAELGCTEDTGKGMKEGATCILVRIS
jgi:hypothetical protein